MELNIIHNADCLDILRDMPSESIDLIVIDPPYKIIPHGSVGTMSGYVTRQKAMRGTVFDYNDIDISDYIDDLYRVLKDTAHCYIMCNNFNLPHFFDVIGKSKFKFTKLLIWDKCSPICGRYYMTQTEFIFLLRKGSDKQINNCGTTDILRFPNKRDKHGNLNIHDSQKPVSLFQTLIENSSNEGEVVFDPFMGSGTTAIACIRSNRRYVGCEIDNKFYELANKRIKLEKQQIKLFTI